MKTHPHPRPHPRNQRQTHDSKLNSKLGRLERLQSVLDNFLIFSNIFLMFLNVCAYFATLLDVLNVFSEAKSFEMQRASLDYTVEKAYERTWMIRRVGYMHGCMNVLMC